MIKFDYLQPKTLKSALGLLEKHGDEARAIAGGTSLLIMMRQRLLMPKVVVSLADIPKFDRITYSAKNGLTIGAGRATAISSFRRPSNSTIPCCTKPFTR